MRTPVSVIEKALKTTHSLEQERANRDASTVARLTTVMISIAHGFSGSKSRPPKVKVQDFLPYPDWKPESNINNLITDETTKILLRLLKRRQIPTYVFTALKSSPDEQP